jgi:hypothetical protein
MGADKAKAEKEVGRLRGELEAAIAKVSGEEKRRGGRRHQTVYVYVHDCVRRGDVDRVRVRERVISVTCYIVSPSLHNLLPVCGGERGSLLVSSGGAVEVPARGPGAQGGVREETGERDSVFERERGRDGLGVGERREEKEERESLREVVNCRRGACWGVSW